VALGLEQLRLPDSHRDRVLELFDGLGRPEREHGRRRVVGGGDSDRLLDGALLVRADREPEVRGVDRPLVRRERDPRAGLGTPLDEDQDAHQQRTRVFSGSKSDRDPTTSTVTGYRSPMYWTRSELPSTACSGGRYDMRTCLPTDGPEPALVTYDGRPFA